MYCVIIELNGFSILNLYFSVLPKRSSRNSRTRFRATIQFSIFHENQYEANEKVGKRISGKILNVVRYLDGNYSNPDSCHLNIRANTHIVVRNTMYVSLLVLVLISYNENAKILSSKFHNYYFFFTFLDSTQKGTRRDGRIKSTYFINIFFFQQKYFKFEVNLSKKKYPFLASS